MSCLGARVVVTEQPLATVTASWHRSTSIVIQTDLDDARDCALALLGEMHALVPRDLSIIDRVASLKASTGPLVR
jgi:hypothetical protein